MMVFQKQGFRFSPEACCVQTYCLFNSIVTRHLKKGVYPRKVGFKMSSLNFGVCSHFFTNLLDLTTILTRMNSPALSQINRSRPIIQMYLR